MTLAALVLIGLGPPASGAGRGVPRSRTGSSRSTGWWFASSPRSSSTGSAPGRAGSLVVAVVSAFVGFVGTLAGARFIERQGA